MQLASVAPEEFELEEGSDQTSDQEAELLPKSWTPKWPKWSKTVIALATALVACVGLHTLSERGQVSHDASDIKKLIMETREQEEEFDDTNWVMVHLPAVCRANKKDLRVFTKPGDTFAKECKKGPCIQKEDMNPHKCAVMCQNRVKSGKRCDGMEYRMSEDRCELREEIGSFVNLDESEKYPDHDFACLLYKPSCEKLESFKKQGASSYDFEPYLEGMCSD